LQRGDDFADLDEQRLRAAFLRGCHELDVGERSVARVSAGDSKKRATDAESFRLAHRVPELPNKVHEVAMPHRLYRGLAQ
jgi:hypothetical protein